MMLPSTLADRAEWTFLGPMGPHLSDTLSHLPRLAVDGGARYASSFDVWVGDGDSFQEKVEAPHIFRLPVDKDQSDLAQALSLFGRNARYKFHFWGFLGGRRDHELFNLGEASQFLEEHHGCEILFYREDGKVSFHFLGSGHWKFSYTGSFSLGTLKKTPVKLTGACKYPIPKTLSLSPLSSLGLSNEGLGEIELENEGAIFLYFPEGR